MKDYGYKIQKKNKSKRFVRSALRVASSILYVSMVIVLTYGVMATNGVI